MDCHEAEVKQVKIIAITIAVVVLICAAAAVGGCMQVEQSRRELAKQGYFYELGKWRKVAEETP